MKENKEIKALLNLIDDPDQEVYSTISAKLVSFGKEIIPHLENMWENINNVDTQERIELLIHRLHFSDLTAEFINSCVTSPTTKFHYSSLLPMFACFHTAPPPKAA